MRLYSVHHRPSGRADPWTADPNPDLVLVKEGFSWPALLAAPVWALHHRLWLGAAVYVGAVLTMAGAAGLARLNEAGQTVLGVAFALLAGWSANDWRRWTLARRGYREVGVVGGRTLTAAERRLFADAPAAEPGAEAAAP